MRRLHADIVYDGDATTVSTLPDEAFALRRGVCQDFTHIMISGLRALGLPSADLLLQQPFWVIVVFNTWRGAAFSMSPCAIRRSVSISEVACACGAFGGRSSPPLRPQPPSASAVTLSRMMAHPDDDGR